LRQRVIVAATIGRATTRKKSSTDRIDGYQRLIAQTAREQPQMPRHSDGHLAQTDGKPFADFPAERRVVNVVDLKVSSVHGIDHEISDCWRGKWRMFSGEL
jgi:hypothetical protein